MTRWHPKNPLLSLEHFHTRTHRAFAHTHMEPLHLRPPPLDCSVLCWRSSSRGCFSFPPALVRVPASGSIPNAPLSPLQGHSRGSLPDASWARNWKRLLSHLGGTLLGLEQALAAGNSPRPEQARGGEKPPAMAGAEWPVPPHASLFLPEFPVQPPGQQLKVGVPLAT